MAGELLPDGFVVFAVGAGKDDIQDEIQIPGFFAGYAFAFETQVLRVFAVRRNADFQFARRCINGLCGAQHGLPREDIDTLVNVFAVFDVETGLLAKAYFQVEIAVFSAIKAG